MESYLVLIPLLPLAGFLVNGIAGKRLPRPAVSAIACLGPAIACALSFAVFSKVAPSPAGAALTASLGDWMRVGSLSVPFAFSADRLTAVMLLVVTGVGTLIHVYSTGYMKDDPGHARFFAYLNLFMAMMLVLVLASNIVLLFMGWEGVGLCSYLLIGFWYKEPANCDAGIKAFVVNRVGDFGFILGVFLIFVTFGSFDMQAVNAAAASKPSATTFWIALLLFVGATGKSAQIPLYVWLPDAMAGPTPVSALIHAATMVTSGVYLLARLGPLFVASGALPIVAVIGTLTALLAALIAFSQTDIKKVLAYSTVSQLGFMFLACGVGAFQVAIFHVVTHAFFKALLFLGAGAVIHSLHHEQDMRRMGGLWKKLPVTGTVFLCGALALAGFPLTSGFFSKDEILHEALGHGTYVLYGIGLLTALFTAFYTFRQFSIVFLGEYRGGHEHDHDGAHSHEHAGDHAIHESPAVMLGPLVILAVLALGGGFLGVPQFLHGPELEGAAHGQIAGWIVGGTVAILGIAGALVAYVWRPGLVQSLLGGTSAGRRLAKASLDKFYVDELYDFVILKPLRIAYLLLYYVVDRFAIEFVLVRGSGLLVRGLGAGLRTIQTGKIPSYAIYFVGGVVVLLSLVLWAAG